MANYYIVDGFGQVGKVHGRVLDALIEKGALATKSRLYCSTGSSCARCLALAVVSGLTDTPRVLCEEIKPDPKVWAEIQEFMTSWADEDLVSEGFDQLVERMIQAEATALASVLAVVGGKSAAAN